MVRLYQIEQLVDMWLQIITIRNHANGFIFTKSLFACIYDATLSLIDFIESKTSKKSREVIIFWI